jgi:hypothetical protein
LHAVTKLILAALKDSMPAVTIHKSVQLFKQTERVLDFSTALHYTIQN